MPVTGTIPMQEWHSGTVGCPYSISHPKVINR
jgi:hypothetical protein